MAQILQFRLRECEPQGREDEIDLMSAVDIALRDLADIIPHIMTPARREQAEQCRDLLRSAYEAELAAG